ncbi:uncharacterized protein BCR38DRAFT_484865 [Pseudomassariella vexata]|uniref:Uncharacterized protein n=1 Tax=Pseudomassariella vexata TaxID=1141098 RepID=A0A1Y2E2A1_9PEZI|nr:uncharacterized protein BCR38DRAFT_484865 [Pseudomassariella vexata]ORY65446.1 hypothetical protein BCR38DRAFT_484865 [Pseudomassariella vexata]
MPSQIATPIPVTPPRKTMRLVTSEDLFASLNATLASTGNKPQTPVRNIKERDWDVPAPPPPSPKAHHHFMTALEGTCTVCALHASELGNEFLPFFLGVKVYKKHGAEGARCRSGLHKSLIFSSSSEGTNGVDMEITAEEVGMAREVSLPEDVSLRAMHIGTSRSW